MAQLNIRIDENTKNQAELLFTELGMNLSTAITIFIHQAIRERGIPFSITERTDPFYNPRVLDDDSVEFNEFRTHYQNK
jgi:DNA-damage-inducible protein J